jgi:hypothetical protein
MIEISEYKLAAMLEKATEAGANKALTELGLKKSQISQREAYRRFGEARVTKWRMDGKVTPVKIVGKIYYDVQKLEHLKSINDLVCPTK